jgi:hypothetical protein
MERPVDRGFDITVQLLDLNRGPRLRLDQPDPEPSCADRKIP